MTYDEVLAAVRARGEYGTNDEAERVLRAVLAVLGVYGVGGDTTDLAAELPGQVSEVLTVPANLSGLTVRVEDFLGNVAAHLGSNRATARWDATTVLSTLAEGLIGSERNHLLSHLPSGYAALFAHTERS